MSQWQLASQLRYGLRWLAFISISAWIIADRPLLTRPTRSQNLVERRALISATAVGGSAFIFVTGCMANRYKKVKEDLLETQESFRATGSGRKAVIADSV